MIIPYGQQGQALTMLCGPGSVIDGSGIFMFDLPSNPIQWVLLAVCPLTDGESEEQGGQVTCPRSGLGY